MRYLKAFVLVALMMSMSSVAALASDSLTEAANALQHSPVYVSPDAGLDVNTTTSQLQSVLYNDDGIVLVMLPASAEQQLGADPLTIAQRLSSKLGNRRIIGLAVGTKVVGFAPTTDLLPTGEDTDLMYRANSVSQDPITALITFAQNVHQWQSAHPHPKPQPMTVSKKGSFSPLVWFAVVGLAVLIAGVIFAFLSSANSGGPETEPDPSRTKFDAPSHVSDLLSKIARLRSQVKDWQLQQTISLMCRDTEVYFEKYSSNKEQDAKLFENHLAGVEKVITKYVDVQNYQRYYDDPDKLMQRGKSAVNDFAEFVLASCKRGSRAQLMDYSVDTNILSAQRFR